MEISLLQQMYKDVLVGLPLAKESHHYTSLLNLRVEQSPKRDESANQMHLPSPNSGIRSHQDPGISGTAVPITDDVSNNSANISCSLCPREVMLLQLTVIQMMVAKVQSQEIESNTRQKYCDIFVSLLKEAEIDSKLIWLLNSSNQLLSHMASKSLASLVYFQLKEENALNVTWLTFTLNILSELPMNPQAAKCMWTLTAIIRDILKDKVLPKAGTVKLLAPLDAVLEGFYNSILCHHFDSHHYTSPYSEAANNLISFIDLLEALLASRIELEVPLRCQRVLFLKVSYILNCISSSVHYLFKKKLIMLLKKCILYKSREDSVSGSKSLQKPCLSEDVLTLSNGVLQGVSLPWLNQIPLGEKTSYFGGSEPHPGDNSHSGPDQTLLRALSLIVLKALEFKSQSSAAEAEVKGEFQSSMSQLLTFWRGHLTSSSHSHPVVHHCEWLSLIFIEQDDDMWEAAKALLLIYLKFHRLQRDAADSLSLKEEETWDFLTHESGCNPHCIFLFLLKSIAFDSTVLLDFLISSETCFLEYLVRYLKLLREDWHHFINVCNHFDMKHGTFQSISSDKPPHHGKQKRMTDVSLQNACCGPDPQTVSLASSHLVFMTEQGDNEVVDSNQSNSLPCTDSAALLGSLQSLVNYDSSEDSEQESAEKECVAKTKQMPLYDESKAKIREDVCSCIDGKQNALKSEVFPLKQKQFNASSFLTCTVPSDNTIPLRIMLYKSTACLEELQIAISRLQRRNLFPYNPSALLRLLGYIEKIRKDMNSH
ncbi:LINES protein, partial [Eudromia elegans]|nr:LINES protein [Eudromia elegans]